MEGEEGVVVAEEEEEEGEGEGMAVPGGSRGAIAMVGVARGVEGGVAGVGVILPQLRATVSIEREGSVVCV